MDFMFIANDPLHVRCAERAGVDRVMVDLELIGKASRQGHMDTVISNHSLEDVRVVRGIVSKASLLVRVNPIFDGSADEIERVLDLGADIVMLPMFKTVSEVETFIDLVRGRARVCLLLETAESLGRAHQILSVRGIDEVHIGLNDLHLALGLDFMFEVLTGGLVEHIGSLCRERGIKFGFGGVARVGGGMLSAADITTEHARLGSTQVILSRDFRSLFDGRSEDLITEEFETEVSKLRKVYQVAGEMSDPEFDAVRRRVSLSVSKIAESRSVK